MISCVAATLIILAAPVENDPVQPSTGGGGGSYDKKGQTEQNKKNYILKRFISYYPAKRPSY